jgi:hypothetical protein
VLCPSKTVRASGVPVETMGCDGPPKWQYNGPESSAKHYRVGDDGTQLPAIEGQYAMDLGNYARLQVCNVDSKDCGTGKGNSNFGRAYFDLGLRHMLSYQHEMASKCFLASLRFSPHCALAHALVALSHSPNYNFKGDAYYVSTNHPEEMDFDDDVCIFPSQQVANRHSKLAVEKIEEIRRLNRKGGGKRGKKGKGKKASPITTISVVASDEIPELIPDVEASLINAVRILTCNPGVDPGLASELVGRPYADALRKVHERYPDDSEISYFFAESLMVLNAWKLYEYPTGKPLSPDVIETRAALELSLEKHKNHAGLCHLYVHLMEMSSEPGEALQFCGPLRNE